MIKSEIKNYCNYCGKEVPPEHINGLDNNESLYCEYCGTENDVISIEIPDSLGSDLEKKEKNIEKSSAIKNKSGYSQIRFFIFRYIYEILKSPENFSQISEEQQELSLSQLKALSKTLRSMIIDQQIPDYWLGDLSSIERVVLEQTYKNTQSFIIDNDIYQKEFFIYFCQSIEFVAKIINGDHDFSNLQGLKREIADDLKMTYGFASAINSHRDFEFKLTILLSRYIYKDIKSLKPTDNLEKTEFYNKMKEGWINDIKSSQKKRFVKKYVKFQEDLKADQIYFQSFTHHLQYLEEIVSGLIKDKHILHELKGIERVIAEDLKVEVLPNLDMSLQQKFKFNLLIVLSRFIFYFIKLYDDKDPLKKRIEGSIVNIIATNLESEIVANNKLKGAWVEKLYKMNQEEFSQQYKELRCLLNTDWIYKESFVEWVRRLTNIVFNLISGKRKESKLQDFEKLLLKDLNSFFFEPQVDLPKMSKIQNKLTMKKKEIRLYLDSILNKNPEKIQITNIPSLSAIGRKFGGIDAKSISTYILTQYLPNRYEKDKIRNIYEKLWGNRKILQELEQKRIKFNLFLRNILDLYFKSEPLPKNIGVRALGRQFNVNRMTIPKWIKNFIKNWLIEDESLNLYPLEIEKLTEKIYLEIWSFKPQCYTYDDVNLSVESRGGILLTKKEEWDCMVDFPSERRVLIQCEQEHDPWEVRVLDLCRPRWCPHCQTHFCQKILYKYINKILINFSTKNFLVEQEISLKKAYGLSKIEGGMMKFDIYIKDLMLLGKNREGKEEKIEINLAGEYDGIQHDKFPNPFHKYLSEYIAQKARDKLKDEIAFKKKTYLIRIKAIHGYNARTINNFQIEIIRQIQEWTGLKFEAIPRLIYDRWTDSLIKDPTGKKILIPVSPNAPSKPVLSIGLLDKFF